MNVHCLHSTIRLLLALGALCQTTSLSQAAKPSALLGPRIAISTNAPDLHDAPYVACDSVNRRSLVVWSDWFKTNGDIYVCGQLVNADNSLYQQAIPISVVAGSQGILEGPPPLAFDSNHQRFAVVWQDGRDSTGWRVYGQIINADGSLTGSNFRISPTNGPSYYQWFYGPTIQFDSVNDRYLVVYVAGAPGGWGPFNVYGQLVDSGGSLIGAPIQITSNTNDANYYAAAQNVAYDAGNQQFQVTWANLYDGHLYGRLVAASGILIGFEINIGNYGGELRMPSLTFDPTTGRYLQTWHNTGQLLNSDGSLFGTNFPVFNDPNAADMWVTSLVVDTVNRRFIATAGNGVVQLLNLDGSWDGATFEIDSTCRGNSTPQAAYAINGTFGLVTWWAETPPGIYGKKFTLFPIPRVSSMSCTNGIVAISFDNLAAYATNWIERSTNLAAINGWEQIAGPISNVETTNWTEPMTNSFGRAFYRVKSQIPP